MKQSNNSAHERIPAQFYGNLLAFGTIHDFVLHACTEMYYQAKLISRDAHNLTLISALFELFISIPLAHNSSFICKLVQSKYWRQSSVFLLSAKWKTYRDQCDHTNANHSLKCKLTTTFCAGLNCNFTTTAGFLLDHWYPSVGFSNNAFKQSASKKRRRVVEILITEVRPQPQSWKSFPKGNLFYTAKPLIVGITMRVLSWAKASAPCTRRKILLTAITLLISFWKWNNHLYIPNCTLLARIVKHLNKLLAYMELWVSVSILLALAESKLPKYLMVELLISTWLIHWLWMRIKWETSNSEHGYII